MSLAVLLPSSLLRGGWVAKPLTSLLEEMNYGVKPMQQESDPMNKEGNSITAFPNKNFQPNHSLKVENQSQHE